MNSAWKYVSVGLAAVGLTAATSSVMTAYVMRPATPDPLATAAEADPSVRDVQTTTPSQRPVITEISPRATTSGSLPARPGAAQPRNATALRRVSMARVSAEAPSPVVGATSTASPVPPPAPPPAVASAPVVTNPAGTTGTLPPPIVAAPVPAPAPAGATPTGDAAQGTRAGVPADCASGGDRAARIAKPGALGGLLGAALGAAGGAIADGGKGAGKGALIGAGVGAVAGGGYGAYKTKQECGTVFGGSSGSFSGGAPAGAASAPAAPFPGRTETPQAALQSGGAAHGGDITIYDAR